MTYTKALHGPFFGILIDLSDSLENFVSGLIDSEKAISALDPADLESLQCLARHACQSQTIIEELSNSIMMALLDDIEAEKPAGVLMLNQI